MSTATHEAARHLGAYLRASLERAHELARHHHAEELTLEYLLVALLEDEECAATRLVLHAFADPETLQAELVALAPGILVVGSGRSLPFSVRAVRALEAARARAADRGASAVVPADLFACACAELGEAERARLVALGLEPEPGPGPAPAGEPVPREGPLFKHFDAPLRRALGAACRRAAGLSREAISPAHLLGGLLESAPELGAGGWTASRLGLALADRDGDPTPLPERRLALDAELAGLLRGLPQASDSRLLLGRVLTAGREEVRGLFARQKVTPALFEHAGRGFSDPEPEPKR